MYANAVQFYFTEIDYPDVGVWSTRVDGDFVTEVPSFEEMSAWIAAAQKMVDMLPWPLEDSYGPFSCGAWDDQWNCSDGDVAGNLPAAVHTIITFILDGGDCGGAEAHWCKRGSVSAYVEGRDYPVPILRLALVDGRIRIAD